MMNDAEAAEFWEASSQEHAQRSEELEADLKKRNDELSHAMLLIKKHCPGPVASAFFSKIRKRRIENRSRSL